MGDRTPGELRVPDTLWDRDDVRHALARRDVAALFRLVAKYAGASQTRIAIAVGMTQGQVSTIINGSRQVTAIDVAERVMDGLKAPDHARVTFGLAPHASVRRSGEARRDLPGPRQPDTGVGGVAEPTTEDDVHRRSVLRLGGAALGAVAIPASGPVDRLSGVARALTSYNLLMGSAAMKSSVPTVAELSVAVADAKRDYQACRYAAVLDVLPRLLESVQLVARQRPGMHR